jgi:hypothetical protein
MCLDDALFCLLPAVAYPLESEPQHIQQWLYGQDLRPILVKGIVGIVVGNYRWHWTVPTHVKRSLYARAANMFPQR